MIQPKVIKKFGSIEVWLFRGQYYKAWTFSDGVVQLYPSDSEGRTNCMIPVNSHNTHVRKDAVKWLNDNVG